jgi:hypothetical protein
VNNKDGDGEEPGSSAAVPEEREIKDYRMAEEEAEKLSRKVFPFGSHSMNLR